MRTACLKEEVSGFFLKEGVHAGKMYGAMQEGEA